MKYKNSFFRVETKSSGTFLDIFPPKDGGKKLEADEVLDYLEEHSIIDFPVDSLRDFLSRDIEKPAQIKLMASEIPAIAESVKVTISKDAMAVYMRFYPPSNGGTLLTKKEIMAEFQRLRVVFGIREEMIDYFLRNRQYCANIVVAKGEAPIRATDTKIEYFFNTKPLAKPKMLEDGSVDFHELQLFTTVNKGDKLATITPHDVGKAGTNVYGKMVPTNRPKIQHLKYGKNITMSEDETTITSEIDGNVTLVGDTVFVSDTYEVAADVDASTGDIEYDGSVLVHGTVKTGFTVKAKGDIQVNGVVEGATLVAGGNIVIKRGVQGMSKGILKSGGDITAQFFESARVEAAGDVQSGSILHSHIKAGKRVIASGKKGFIVGGEVACDSCVEASSIGNKMETNTIVKVGVKPELHEELKKLIPKVTEINNQYDEINSYLNVFKEKLKNGKTLGPEDKKKINNYNARLDELAEDKDKLNNRLREIKMEMEMHKKGTIKILASAYPGVVLMISSYTYALKNQDSHCLYKVVDGEIKATSY